MAIAKRHVAAGDAWRGRQYIPMRLSTAHATSESMNQKQIAAGELQHASTCFVMVKEMFPRPDSTPVFRNWKNLDTSAAGGSGITDVNRQTARPTPFRVNKRYGDVTTTTFLASPSKHWVVLFQAKFAIVLLDNPIAFAGGVFKLPPVHDLHCATGVLDEFPFLQNTSCLANARSICP